MPTTERDIERKLRILRHAERIGDVSKACRYFGVGRASFYRWKSAFERAGEAGLANRKTIPRKSDREVLRGAQTNAALGFSARKRQGFLLFGVSAYETILAS